MQKYIIGLLAATAQAFDVTCNDDNTLTVYFPFHKEAVLLTATYGTCITPDADGIAWRQDSDDLSFTVELDVTRCGMDSNLRTLEYSQSARFTVGRTHNGQALQFADFVVDSYCSYDDVYEITFDYGTLSTASQTFNDTGGTIILQFSIDAYDENYEGKLSIEDQPSTGGEMIYLGLTIVEGQGFNYDAKTFVMSACSVEDVENTELSYTIYDTDDFGCENDAVDLSVGYDSTSNIWQMSHVLFLLDDVSQSQFSLSCTVIVCDAARSDTCDTVKQMCGI
jgi:hypothetical protein